MKTVSVFFGWTRQRLVSIGRGRLWSALRSMDEGVLSKAGFAPELIQKGPGAWPWRAVSQASCAGVDMPADGLRIDERGRPVPIHTIDQLGCIGTPEPVNRGASHERHEAA